MTLSLVLFALGVGLISLLLLLSTQLQATKDKNLAGISMVIGAKGSPLQLILNSMYHVDAPTGNISIEKARAFLNPRNPFIKLAVPISVGDSYNRYRIVGTDPKILQLYHSEIEIGKLWEKIYEVTLGAAVARDLKMKVGDTFYGTHGLMNDAKQAHADAEAFKVVGILKPSGAVIDQLILTPTQSIWGVHEHSSIGKTAATMQAEAEETHADSTEMHHEHSDLGDVHTPLMNFPEKDITAILVQAKGMGGIVQLQDIAKQFDLMAASPGVEVNRLFDTISVGEKALQGLVAVIIFVSGLSIFISLYASLQERRYELSLMRVMGASRGRLFVLIVLEGLLLSVLGYVIGILLSHVSMEILAGYMKASYRYSFTGWTFLPEEMYLLFAALGIGFFAAVIPAMQAMRTDISKTLAEG